MYLGKAPSKTFVNHRSSALALASIVIAVLLAANPAPSSAEFHSEASNTVLTGKDNLFEEFRFDAGTVTCQNASYLGAMNSATSTSIGILPSYSSCTTTFGLNAPIDTNGCEYVLHEETLTFTGGKFVFDQGKFDIACPFGKVIEVTAPGCTVTVGPQTGRTGLEFSNLGSGSSRSIWVFFVVSGLNYEEHNKGFFPTCANNTVPTIDGILAGEATLTGETIGKNLGIWYS